MIAQIIKYANQYAKIKVLTRNFLTDENYKDLLSKKSVVEITSYLKNNTHYSALLSDVTESTIHRGELEKILNKNIIDQYAKICRSEKGSNKEIIHTHALQMEIEMIKKMLRMLQMGTLSEFTFNENSCFLKHITINIEKLITSSSIAQFLENLKGSIYYKVLLPFINNHEYSNIFSMEMTLDVHYFKSTWKIIQTLANKQDKLVAEKFYGMQIDMLNILWILRCKKYLKMPNELIYSFIIPINYELERKQIIAIVDAPTIDETMAILEKTRYKNIFNKDELYLEQYYDQYVLNTVVKLLSKKPFSLIIILSYLHFKEIEVNNITKIIEGVRYCVYCNQIEQYLVRKGGANNVN